MVQQRDQEKRKACEKAGITLIEIPYWWDDSIETLAETLKKHRYIFYILNELNLSLDLIFNY